MKLDILQAGAFAPTNVLLIDMSNEDYEAMLDNWQDQAAEASISGNPRAAFYIEHMIERARVGFR